MSATKPAGKDTPSKATQASKKAASSKDETPPKPAAEIKDGTPATSVLDHDPGDEAETFTPTDPADVDLNQIVGKATDVDAHVAAAAAAPNVEAMPPTVPASAAPAANAALHSGSLSHAFADSDPADDRWAKRTEESADEG